MNLGRDVFVALSAVIWADGEVTENEAEALLSAARANGLAGSDLAAVERATRVRTDVDVLVGLALSPEEQSFVYGIAAWLTCADGKVTHEELALLDKLGDALGLSAGDRDAAASAAVATMGDHGAPARHDVLALADQLRSAAEA